MSGKKIQPNEPELIRNPKPAVTTVEHELRALEIIISEFKELDDDARVRVLHYLRSRFDVYIPGASE